MNNYLKQKNGVTMISLVITVIMIFILASMLLYNTTDSNYIQRINSLYADIELLRDKVSEFYEENNKLPVSIKYTLDKNSDINNVLSKNNDFGDFYVIDLERLEGLSLNYGKDYENVKNNSANVEQYKDLYIINENSHNIFYVNGVVIKENGNKTKYYTDYKTPDETKIDLRYIDGILIPDGYYYIGKIKDNGGNESIVISNNKDGTVDDKLINNESQYVWTKQVSEISELPASVKLSNDQTLNSFLESVNYYKGYFKNTIGNDNKYSVIYLKVNY